MRSPTSCFFCAGPSESRPVNNFTACRKCLREKVAPFLRDALGPDETRRLLAGDQGGEGPTEAQQSSWQRKMDRLLDGAKRSGVPAALPVETLMSRGTGRPPRRRGLTPAEQALALRRAEARQRGQALPSDVAAAVRRAGLRTA